MVEWKAKTIVDVIEKIQNEKFVLPVIQRDFVWEEEQVKLLFDTLLKENSFGGIIVIAEKEGDEPLFSFRSFKPDVIEGGNFIPSILVEKIPQDQLFVIDGQQRLQSLYIGLSGSMDGKILYFDLFSDYNSEYDFKFEKDFNSLPPHLKDNSDRPIQEHLWYPIKNLFTRLKNTGCKDDQVIDEFIKQVINEIIKEKEITVDKQKDHIKRNVSTFCKNVTASVLGISIVTVNKNSLPKARMHMVELFRRLNQGGKRLSSFGLMASKLKGYEWELESFLREIHDKYQDIGLTQDNLIKLIFLLQDDPIKNDAIEASDAEFAIKYEERIKITIKSLKDFLEESKLCDYYKGSNGSFIPLFFVAYHLFYKEIKDEEINEFFANHDVNNSDFIFMKRWVFNSLLNGVFKIGVGWNPYKTGIREILEVIKDHKNKPFPTQELFNLYRRRLYNFILEYSTDNIDSLYYRNKTFIFYLMYDLKPPKRINDIDHIMPRSILEYYSYAPEKINNIKNYQLLFYRINRNEKKAKPFSEWFNNHVDDKTKAEYLESHLIPKDKSLWKEETSFEEFSEERGKLILEKILEYTK